MKCTLEFKYPKHKLPMVKSTFFSPCVSIFCVMKKSEERRNEGKKFTKMKGYKTKTKNKKKKGGTRDTEWKEEMIKIMK